MWQSSLWFIWSWELWHSTPQVLYHWEFKTVFNNQPHILIKFGKHVIAGPEQSASHLDKIWETCHCRTWIICGDTEINFGHWLFPCQIYNAFPELLQQGDWPLRPGICFSISGSIECLMMMLGIAIFVIFYAFCACLIWSDNIHRACSPTAGCTYQAPVLLEVSWRFWKTNKGTLLFCILLLLS